jgi:hypothetical protein
MNPKKVTCTGRGAVEYNGDCVSKCPDGTFLSNGSCLQQCNPHKGWFDKVKSFISVSFAFVLLFAALIIAFVLFMKF